MAIVSTGEGINKGQVAEVSSGEQQFAPLPTSIDQLKQYCLSHTQIAPNMRFCPALALEEADIASTEPIDGQFGLQLFVERSGNVEVLANTGFFVDPDGTMVIRHTPQGLHQDSPSHKARELLSGRFRHRMMVTMVQVAQSLGCPRVLGISAENHTKVQQGYLSPERAKLVIDDIYRDTGFKNGIDRNWHYSFHSNS